MSNEKGPLNLSGNQYWNNPLDHAGDAGMERLMNDIEGMILDMPSKVYLDERKTIPLICLWTQDKQKARSASLATTTWLILTHLESGSSQVVKLARSPDVRNDGPVSKGWINEWHEADLKDLVHLGPSLGRYCAWLVSGSQSSNIRNFELYPNGKAEQSNEVRARISNIQKGLENFETGDLNLSPLLEINSDDPGAKSQGPLFISQEKSGDGRLKLKVKYKIAGLEKFLAPPSKLMKDKSGRVVYAWLPLLLLGFTKDSGFAYENRFLIPVVVKPTGLPGSPLLEGSATILLNKDSEFYSSSIANLWVTTLGYRTGIEIRD